MNKNCNSMYKNDCKDIKKYEKHAFSTRQSSQLFKLITAY